MFKCTAVMRVAAAGLALFAISPVLHLSAQSEQVTLCHIPPGDPENGQTITVGGKAADAHLRNHDSDMLGNCPEGMGGSFVSAGVLAVASAGWGMVRIYRRRKWQSA